MKRGLSLRSYYPIRSLLRTSVPRGQDSSLLTQHGNYLLDHRFDYDPAVETEISNFARRDSVKCALGCEQVNGVLLACARRGADVCAKLCHHMELVPPLLTIETPHFGICENQFEQRGSQPTPSS